MSQPSDVDPSPNRAKIAVRWLWRVIAAFFSTIWSFLRNWFWQLTVAALVVAFIIYEVRPFDEVKPLHQEDVALAWNQSIARLGILPVFPPEEDFHVGDVWAVISEADDEASEVRPLLGKSVRLAHIDLREELAEEHKGQPIFADTAEFKSGEAFRRQPRAEVTSKELNPKEVRLSLTAFPGIAVTHSTSTAGSFGMNVAGFGASNQQQSVEEVRIPVAETYGVSALKAFYRLDEWCRSPTTKIYCSDEFVRRVLAFSVGSRVQDKREGKYLSRIQLRFVTRVFLTREIQHRKHVNVGRGGAAQTLSEAAAPNSQRVPSAIEKQSTESSQGDAQLAQSIASSARTQGAEIISAFGDTQQIQLREVFQRPVVFGYRAITIRIEPN
ncbi:hypothetical protein [Bradyrhizobium sp. LMTR 3]|uniref:hypothetical protein n=1 Tax=Bradyrhizobium sp. LMTR 3 TaxID=189873 RepID=UPI000810C41F|nr:hypothetical protein [Bradyrhizobium sp. LMTR 3]OCK55057.1 hypothetical protein LMTR3_09835 [Bradyrhizobium sp. LMTR 3]